MKKLIYALTLSLLFTSVIAQESDTTEIEEITFNNKIMYNVELPAFHAINIIGGKVYVMLDQGDTQEVFVENGAAIIEDIELKVEDETLVVSTKEVPDEVTIHVTVVSLDEINVSNISRLKSTGKIETSALKLSSDGTTEISLLLDADYLETKILGASELKLTGQAGFHKLNIAGAAEIKAADFITDSIQIDISGAGDAKLMASQRIFGEISGAAKLEFFGDPDISDVRVSGAAVLKGKGNLPSSAKDTVDVRIGGLNFKITEDESEKDKKEKRKNDIELWSGFDLGVNGYLNASNGFDMPAGYNYLELNPVSSMSVGFNLFEKDLPLIRNYFELVTGMGFTINNYKFANNTRIVNNPNQFTGIIDTQNVFDKTKLRVSYINVPLLFEINTHANPNKAIHLAAGFVFGYNIGAKTKIVYEVNGKSEKSHDGNNYFINPYKCDATVRIGYGDGVMLFASYSLTTLFRNNKGPELYPTSIGIAFVGL